MSRRVARSDGGRARVHRDRRRGIARPARERPERPARGRGGRARAGAGDRAAREVAGRPAPLRACGAHARARALHDRARSEGARVPVRGGALGVSAFADLHVTFGADAPAPAPARREHAWRAAAEQAGAWSAWVAADPARGLVQTRAVAPWSVWLVGGPARYEALSGPPQPPAAV